MGDKPSVIHWKKMLLTQSITCQLNPKNHSKKVRSLSSTLCFFSAWLLFLLNRETGGSIFVMAVPLAGMAPSTAHWNVLDSLMQFNPFSLLYSSWIFLSDYAPHPLSREAGKCRAIVFPMKKLNSLIWVCKHSLPTKIRWYVVPIQDKNVFQRDIHLQATWVFSSHVWDRCFHEK